MTIDETQFESVCAHARRAALLSSTADALEWDEQTGMPIRGGEYRAEQVSNLRAMAHDIRTDAAYGDQLSSLAEKVAGDSPHCDTVATILGLNRDYSRDRKLPTELVQAISVATVRGQQVWKASRKADDYSMFRDALANMIELKTEAGNRLCEDTELTAYEALMDEYEPDARVDEIQQVFDDVRGPLVDLIAAVADAPRRPNVELLQQEFGIEAQRQFSQYLAGQVGFDFDAGRLDETAHPFCTTLGPEDVRILTRYESNWLPCGVFGTLHEAGHGMYEQGLRPQWFGLPPGTYVSLGIHESQSRLWENQVGRSRAFWQSILPAAAKTFPDQLSDVSLDQFYAAVNTVQPSLIRVEADEATYNLHIIIRFDLEQRLIAGELSVDDLPEAWNARYESDLGVRPPSAASGVLQDVHWSAGLIGYFPTYTLGNVAAAQLFAAANQQLGDLAEQHRCGEFGPLLEWLRENVHRHGRCYSGAQLVQRACGQPLSADHLIDYLTTKLTAVYGI